ncbi:hypothetical protein CASFOL_011724 [Castilleja foliolosa]|uniref:DNA helicase Pif1-like 2B domain-containing protein n=1 Tax=Castilleja foliolosa TaxID=1961234 RepID=A0ABD3DQ57_9LAMI
MYRFRDLWEIANDINVDNNQLLDVIGRVVSYQKPTFVAKCSTRRMDFTIANTENKKLGCSLWGDYIDPVLSIFEKEDSKPLIICIQFGKITRYRERIDDPKYLQDRAILAPTLDVVDAVNDYMISKMSGDCYKYYSSNTVCRSDSAGDMLGDVHTSEFLNSIKCSGVPNHELNLKVGTPVMLLRNTDSSNGLCNSTRLLITRLGSYVLECKILTGHSAGEKVLIPRLSLTPSDVRVPFKFQRRQFPVMISYAMTINKSQGQSLANVGLYLKKPVFSHGQLYVAVSRVTNPTGLKILLCPDEDDETNSTVNVVYKEIFQNL